MCSYFSLHCNVSGLLSGGWDSLHCEAYSGHGWVQTILLSLSTRNIPSCLGREKCERTKEGGAEEVDCISILQPQLGRRKKGRLYLHRGKTVENKPSVEKKNRGSPQRVTVKLLPHWLLFPCQLSYMGRLHREGFFL